MITISYTCDRCHQKIQYDIPFNYTHYAGHDVTPNGSWGKYGRPGEKNVCLSCLEADPNVPRYLFTGSLG